MHFASPLLLAVIVTSAIAAPATTNASPATLDKRVPKKFMGWKVGSSSSSSAAAKAKRSGTHFDFRGKRSITKRETYQADLDYLSELQNSTNAQFLTQLDAAGGTCNSSTIAKRQEYGSMTAAQRIAYTDAVLCLQNKTANTPSTLVPGAKTRYDDFVATHINQTEEIHFTGTFLGWHRHFTWTYEQALRNECGYDGYQPYFNWPLWAESPETSPLFDGSNTSLSGNGEYIEGHEGTVLTATGTSGQDITIQLEPGLGGGCVTSGPFKDMVVNLGPVSEWNFTDNAAATEDGDGGFAYNPRCLKRDIGGNTAMLFTNATQVAIVMNETTIWSFEEQMQGTSLQADEGNIGIHGGGHYTYTGDPAGDLYTSPGDPTFFLHHGNIDRLWTMWQNMNITDRQDAISGTGTWQNSPESANTTLDTEINVGWAAGATVADGTVKMSDVMSNVAGEFCYMYV